jgi:osmotically-inducible protein OsmY
MSSTDKKIKMDIVQQIFWDSRVESSEINVTVNEGVVVLSGVVSTFLERKAAFEDACSVPGVLSVENQIQVAAPAGIPVRSDSEIKVNVEKLLDWNPILDVSRIKVAVHSSNVVLEGVVDAYWKKIYVEKLAAAASGMIKVTNNLAVVPSKQIADEAIAKDVTEALRRNAAVDVDSLGLKVENGVVTLTGTVENWGAKTAAFFVALHTRGVVHVDDRLTVKRL